MNINWKAIKEKCPESLKLFVLDKMAGDCYDCYDGYEILDNKMFRLNSNHAVLFFDDICHCDLESFFFNNDIIITYRYSIRYATCQYIIYNKKTKTETYDGAHDDYAQEKLAAITKAFEILEATL
jgi:hypothetical protein